MILKSNKSKLRIYYYLKIGAHINRSLLALGNCINALSEKATQNMLIIVIVN
jgi:hypothetical protein